MTEYGVHWNFFFTLALLPIFGAMLERLSPFVDYAWMALIVGVGAQAKLPALSLLILAL